MNTRTRAARVEGVVLVAIVVLVGTAAGAASFTHVHDWTMANSPDGTHDWFGWANAVISELVPIAALLTIRRRKRTGGSIRYPIAMLIAAAGLSLAAQLGVAVGKVGPSGWLLSAVPALAFMALVKLVLSPVHFRSDKPTNETATTPPVEPAPASPTVSKATSTAEPASAHPLPAVQPEPAAPVHHADPEVDEIPVAAPEPIVTDIPEPAAVEPTPQPAIVPTPEPVVVPAHLVPIARFSVVQHEQATGRPITADELATRLDITPAVAGQLIAELTPATVNGTPIGGAR